MNPFKFQERFSNFFAEGFLPGKLAALFFALLLPMVAKAQYTYETTNGSITITRYTGPDGEVTIPEMIEGLPVTRIGTLAFDQRYGVTGVTIPQGVLSIDEIAFVHCGLANITISESVTNIGDFAFAGCASLRGVWIPKGVISIGSGVFVDCQNLENIFVDAQNQFYDSVEGVLRDKLRNVVVRCPEGKDGTFLIPEGVTGIATEAFWSCYRLTDIVIPPGVTSIGEAAFDGCFSLTNIVIPDSVVNVGNRAFMACQSLTDCSIGNGVLNVGDATFAGCFALTRVTIGNSVQSIGQMAFFNSGIGQAVIPNSVTNIGGRAFGNASRLTSVTIGSGVVSLGPDAFSDSLRLKAVTVDAQNPVYTSIDGVLFDKSSRLLVFYPPRRRGSYVVPESVTTIASHAFQNSMELSKIAIGTNVSRIGAHAFSLCTELHEVTLSSGITSIEEATFEACTALSRITLPESVTSIGAGAFIACSQLKTVKMGASVTNVGGRAFAGCSALLRMELPEGVRNIPLGAFEGCSVLGFVTMGSSMTNIDYAAFRGCANLTSVTIPASVTNINSAFEGCSKLKNIYFLGSPAGTEIFDATTPATIYYFPGAPGWGKSFQGRPTVPWDRRPSTTERSFGVRSNQFGFNILWANAETVVVEACENIVEPLWFPVSTNTLAGGKAYFCDPQWAGHPTRYYRLRGSN
jgi:hypothetical protein